MILEAFAEFLRSSDPAKLATDVLAQWLVERLSNPPLNNVDRVLHCEMAMSRSRKGPVRLAGDQSSGVISVYNFRGRSDSGRRLLRSLYEYCQSYEQQKWSRFVHQLKASDFRERSVGG